MEPVRVAAFDELDARTLYALLRLRVDVFVVEQRCPYPELDGRDTEPATRHLWVGDPPQAYLRLLDGTRIGRVVTSPAARGNGLAGRLLEVALDLAGDRTVRLDAQTHAAAFYEKYGFVRDGPEFTDDGIPHVPMIR